MRWVSVRGMKPGTETKTKTMKNMMKYAVVACVAFFALNSQSEAASLHINLGGNKDKVCCEHEHRNHVKKHDKKHCCHEAMKMDKHRRPAAPRHRKECCHHGR